VSGRVFDAATNAPIARFRVILGTAQGEGVRWQPHRITDHEGGRFALPPDPRAWEQTWFRVEAEGYRPCVSRSVKKSEGVVALEFALVADPGLAAVVRTPEGAPASGAQASWSTGSLWPHGNGATISLFADERLGARVVTADGEGRLQLPPEPDPGIILVAHPSGYAEVKPAELAASPLVRLRRWCRVEGQVLAGTKPVPGQSVSIYHVGPQSNDFPWFDWEARAVTDGNGRFACDRVIQGRLVIDREFALRGEQHVTVNGLATTIRVSEGQVTRVTLGGPGRTLVGRFEAPRDLGLPIDWSKVHLRLGLHAPHIGFPGDDEVWKTYGAFLSTEEGKAYYRDGLPVGRDGSFRIEGVPTGRFQLIIWVTGPAVGKPDEADTYYASGGTEIEVEPTPAGGSDEPLPLGSIVLPRRGEVSP
jgi:hypothetical protein